MSAQNAEFWIMIVLPLSWVAAVYFMSSLTRLIPAWAKRNMDSSLAVSLGSGNVKAQSMVLSCLYLVFIVLYFYNNSLFAKAAFIMIFGMNISSNVFFLWGRFIWDKKMPGYHNALFVSFPLHLLLAFLFFQSEWFSNTVMIQIICIGFFIDMFCNFAPLLFFDARNRNKKRAPYPPQWEDF